MTVAAAPAQIAGDRGFPVAWEGTPFGTTNVVLDVDHRPESLIFPACPYSSRPGFAALPIAVRREREPSAVGYIMIS
jgi:hypothetical protein